MMKFGQFVYVWTDLNRFLNKLNRFLNRFYVWTWWTVYFYFYFYEVSIEIWTNFVWIGWTDFFMKFLWNLNKFCCCFFLTNWTDFMCEQVEQIFLWSFCEIWTDFVAFFFNRIYVWTGWTYFFYKKEKIEF